MKNTIIIYLTGKPGVGKYTIAKELARNKDYIVCDNQLINTPIFELMGYDGLTKIPELCWQSVKRIRDEIYSFLTNYKQGNYILTNNLYEDDGDRNLYQQVKNRADSRGSFFVPIKLRINEQEHLKRITRIERRIKLKTIDAQFALDKTPLLSFSHDNLLELEISNLEPIDAAHIIEHHIMVLVKKPD